MFPFRFRGFLGVCALLIFSHIASPVSAAPRLVDEYVITSWTDEDGLFGGWIVGIAQDVHGYLWIGTVSGVIRFDGQRFERFRGTDTIALPQRSVLNLTAARDGSIWIGFGRGGGLYRIRDGHVDDFGPARGLGRGRITALVEDTDGAMLAAMPDGLYRLAADRWERIQPSHGLPEGAVHTVFRDRTGAVWAATSAAMFRRGSAAGPFERVIESDAAPLNISDGPNAAMWMTDPEIGYTRLDDRSPRPSRAASRRGAGYRLLHDHFGNMWVATLGQGLWFLRRGQGAPQVVGSYNGLSNDTVRALFEDQNGDVWVGTTVGLHRFARRRVTPLTDLGVVRAVAATPDGNVWVGTGDGIVRVVDGVQRWYRTEDGLPSANVTALHVDGSGALLAATVAGVAELSGQRFQPLRLDHGSWPAGITAIARDAAGTVWICTQDHGLFRWRDRRLSIADAVAGSDVYSMTTDKAGRTWIILDGGGLGLISPQGTVELLRESDRFHQSDLAVYEDDAGAMWFGGGDRLSRFRDGKLDAIRSINGLPPESIRAITGDRFGNLWIGMSGGIIRLAASEFDRALADPTRHLDFRSYNSSDGLAGVPVRTGEPAATRGADGRLWFVTGNGVTVLEPQRLSATRPPPAVRIERVTANGRSFQPTAPFDLPPRTTRLEIDYAALEFFSPRQVEFHYRLEGLDDSWTEAGSRRQASFTNLPPRRYRFHVIARSSEGIWNEAGDAIEFSIQPMFYQTDWFLGLSAVAAVGMVFGVWRLRLREVRRQFAVVLTERARMAREIHDTLLQSLAGLELQVDAMSSQLDPSQGVVRQQLERVRRQIQSDVTEARQSIWDLRSPSLETRDLVSALRELGEVFAGPSGVRFEFAVSGSPSRCAPKVEEHLLRVGREAVSNAVRHAHASLVRCELHYGPDSITLRVSDDGRGFDVGEAARQTERHWGLATMHERAQAIGGHLTLVSRPGAGTDLEMIAPLLSSSHP